MSHIKIGDKAIGIKQVASRVWLDRTCFLCGKHFREEEKFAIVICPSELRKQFPKFQRNQLIHLNELNAYIAECETAEELFEKLSSAKKPKKETITKEQDERLDTFIRAAYNIGYKYAANKKDGSVSCKKNGSSDTLIYSVYTDRIEFRNRRRRQLGDGFIERGVIAKAYNEFHNLLGDGKHDDYDPLKAFSECFNSAVETTNKIMGG